MNETTTKKTCKKKRRKGRMIVDPLTGRLIKPPARRRPHKNTHQFQNQSYAKDLKKMKLAWKNERGIEDGPRAV